METNNQRSKQNNSQVKANMYLYPTLRLVDLNRLDGIGGVTLEVIQGL